MNFTEQEILQDALIAHKFLIDMYCQFGIECSNMELRNLFNEQRNVALDHEFKIFTIINEKGFYPLTPAPAGKIKQTYKMHSKMQTNLETKLKK